jgi:hypothetical protein
LPIGSPFNVFRLTEPPRIVKAAECAPRAAIKYQSLFGFEDTPFEMESMSKTITILNLEGKLKRKPSGGERAWFLGEESEPRNKLVFPAGENQRADVSASLPVVLSRLWRCLL